jgi:hypothetical protein
MTDEQTALARRAVACRGWRRMPGMRAVGKYPSYPVRIHAFGENVQDTDDMLAADKWLPWRQPTEYGDHSYPGPYLPDLSDPATLGCLLALVREAWGIPSLSLSPWQGGWEFAWAEDGAVGPCGYWLTEAEALVAALEAAP